MDQMHDELGFGLSFALLILPQYAQYFTKLQNCKIIQHEKIVWPSALYFSKPYEFPKYFCTLNISSNTWLIEKLKYHGITQIASTVEFHLHFHLRLRGETTTIEVQVIWLSP